jgi:hypothetical protein
MKEYNEELEIVKKRYTLKDIKYLNHLHLQGLPRSYSRDRNYLRKLRDEAIAKEIQQLEEYYNK